MMNQESRYAIVKELMSKFASDTGLSPASDVQRRYLWTDAFAVCNFLELYRQTQDEGYRNFALMLVDQVHWSLGRHRKDDHRAGWISGLDEQEGKLHPTSGGLRIGKKMNERGPDDPVDEDSEWDRDGQYFHYLTKWMQALNRVSGAMGDPTFNRWAVELAKTAHDKFTYSLPPLGQKRMCWKMSIDLSYPLVSTMGHHDPLDGFITYMELHAMSKGYSEGSLELTEEIADMAAICSGKDWTTDDPLGIGGLLADAYRVAQMMAGGIEHLTNLLATLLDASRVGLARYTRTSSLKVSARYRLAFRELGLSLGVHAVERLQRLIQWRPDIFEPEPSLRRQVEEILSRYESLAEIIENFWLEPANRRVRSFAEHADINAVMLATSLVPDAYLTVPVDPRSQSLKQTHLSARH